MMDLKGHASIVTGAGAGLGRGAAIGLATCGAAVAAIDINPKTLDQAVHEIQQRGGTAQAFVADVSDAASIADAFSQISQVWIGGVDSLVNVAGVEFFKDFDAITLAEWQRQIAVNLTSVFLCAQQVIPLISKRGGGSIVNTASVQAQATTGRTAPYAAAKGGIVAMSRDLARDLGPRGIRVNTICPGCVHSPMLDRSYDSPEARQAGLSALASVLPLRRIGTPEDFANLVAFLVSPMSSYVTGQSIALDGGMMCRLPLT